MRRGTQGSGRSPPRDSGRTRDSRWSRSARGARCAEAGLRLFVPQPLAERYGAPRAGGPLVRLDPELGWTLRPNVAGLESDEPWQADVRDERARIPRRRPRAKKAAGVTRVAVLGDSFVFGSGVLQDETLTRGSRAAPRAVLRSRQPRRSGLRHRSGAPDAPALGTAPLARRRPRRLLLERRDGERERRDLRHGEAALLLAKGAPDARAAGRPSRGHSALARLDAVLEGALSPLVALARARSGRATGRRDARGAARHARPLAPRRAAARDAEFALTWALLDALARRRALSARRRSSSRFPRASSRTTP